MIKSIRDWPEAERPREKMMQKGAHVLSDAELLAVLFGKGTRGQDVVTFSRDLLVRFGGLRGSFLKPRRCFRA